MAGLFACRTAGTKVVIRQDLYAPSFAAKDLSAYKGKSVYFPAVTNNANNTSIWNYYSPGSDVYYEATPALQTYFWDCFAKDFNWIGVKLAPDATAAPHLEVIMNSVTDQEFKFQVILLGPGKPPFRKDYTVTMAPTKEKDPAQLEKRGYQLVDAAFMAMVGDADFRKAFLSK
jgi:hypothetical protein